MNETPSGERLHIGFFGKRNAGKSSIVNAITGQDLAIVSDIKGTTTDPVYKSMELLPLGPVVIIDTPGLDDEGELGQLRIQKARQVINKTDIAVIAADGREGIGPEEKELMNILQKKQIPFLLVYTKKDLTLSSCGSSRDSSCDSSGSSPCGSSTGSSNGSSEPPYGPVLWTSTVTGEGIHELKEAIGQLNKETKEGNANQRFLLRDLIEPSDLVVLVIPIDKAAPKGRLILPQQQTIRDILDGGGNVMICKENELASVLTLTTKKPKLVITDSQIFPLVDRLTPKDILMTSFSVLFARYKGNLWQAEKGARALETLKNGDKILISEGCTHHRQCGDIGTCKLPAMIKKYTGKEPQFIFTSGTEFPQDLSGYHMVIHCGGCMLTEREMKYRLATAADQDIPMTNYGIIMAYMGGILERSLEPLVKK